MIHSTAIIYPNVILGQNCLIEAYCIIGVPPRNSEPGELPTIIGDNAVIRSHSIIYAGNRIGDNFQCGHKANFREENQIGNDVSVGTHSVIEHHVVVGDGVRIHTQVFIPEYSTLESNCWIGPNAVFTNAKYPKSPNAKRTLQGPTVREGAIISANVTLLPGVVIGKHCLIGAGSVVTKNVADKCVAIGNPARTIKSIEQLPYDTGDNLLRQSA